MRILLLLCLILPAQAADLPPPTPPMIRADPVQTLMLDAREAIQNKDWKTAETALRAVLQQQPRHADALNLLGYTLRWQQRLDESLAAYRQALAIEPDHSGAHEYIARSYLALGRLNEARQHADRLRQLCRGCAESLALDAAIAGASKP